MPYTHPVTQAIIRDFLAGVIVPLFTPVNEKNGIDFVSLKNYVKWLADNPNVTTLFIRSGVGQMFTYSLDEVKRSLDAVLEAANGKKPILCGTTGEYHGDFTRKADPKRYLDQTLELTLYAQQQGADAAVLVVPATLPVDRDSTHEDTIVAFVEAVHRETEIPLLLYNPQMIPADYSTTQAIVKRIAPLPRVIGIKLSTNDMYWMGRLIEAAGENEFTTIAGSECAYYQALATGAAGVIGQGCSVYPNILRRIFDAFNAGDWATARQAQFDVNRALDGFQDLPPDQSGFAYLRKEGLDISPFCRSSREPLDDETVNSIHQAIEPIVRQY